VGNLSNPLSDYFEKLGGQFEWLYLHSQTLAESLAA
jgi:hypothetical protein